MDIHIVQYGLKSIEEWSANCFVLFWYLLDEYSDAPQELRVCFMFYIVDRMFTQIW